MQLPDRWRNPLLYALAAVVVIGVVVAWRWAAPDRLPEGIVGGNGRLEATTLDVAAKSGGRLQSLRVREGDFACAGRSQTLAKRFAGTCNGRSNRLMVRAG